MSEGWIKVHRSIQDHWVWKEFPYSYGQAWIDLLLLANHEDKKIPYRDEIIVCKRGTVNRSIKSLAERWKWDRRTVKKFLDLLEKDGMCTTECSTHRTTITIENYDIYQDVGTTKCTTKCDSKSQQDVQQGHTNKNDKNEKKEEINIKADDSPVFISLLLNDSSLFDVTEKMVTEFKELYPNCDVEQELRNMKGWLNSNPTKRKTRSGIKRFINSWLAREQNRGGGKNQNSSKPVQNGFATINRTDFNESELEKLLGV